MKPLSKEELREIGKKFGSHGYVVDLLKEIKRLKRCYIAEELIFLSPIAERTGRRVKILVNKLNADAACKAVQQGVEELYEDVNKWHGVSVEELRIPVRYMRYLQEAGIDTVGELMLRNDKELQKIEIFSDAEVYRIGVALKGIGIHD